MPLRNEWGMIILSLLPGAGARPGCGAIAARVPRDI